MENGYSRSKADPLIFSHWPDDKKFIIMCIHVDDFYVVASEDELLKKLYGQLVSKYGEVSIVEGDLLAYLGIKVSINESNGCIDISQPIYVQKLVDLFLRKDMPSKRLFRSPLPVTESYHEGDEEPFDQREYLRMVGGLNYLAQYTRPDILFSVSTCAQQCAHPTKGDVRRCLRIFKYLRDTIKVGITFHPGAVKLVCYVDASYNAYEDAKGHYGYTFSLGLKDGSFYARSRRMKLTVMSSTEAEYVGLCEATRDVVWLRRLLEDIGFPQALPTDRKSVV